MLARPKKVAQTQLFTEILCCKIVDEMSMLLVE